MRKFATLLVTVVLFLGCATPHEVFLDNRDKANAYAQLGYDQLDKKKVARAIIIRELKVFVTSEPLGKTKDGRRIIGYATSNNIIVLNATMLKGKIVVNEWVLGHELLHILSNNDGIVADPDRPPLRAH